MREVREYLTYLDSRARIDSSDIYIIEKVWIGDKHSFLNSSSTLYSGCYIKKWYHLTPKLRLMTTDGVVQTK
jgi:hypothetical protein